MGKKWVGREEMGRLKFGRRKERWVVGKEEEEEGGGRRGENGKKRVKEEEEGKNGKGMGREGKRGQE